MNFEQNSPPATLTNVESTLTNVGGGEFLGVNFGLNSPLKNSPPATLSNVESTLTNVGGGDFSGVIFLS